MRIFYASDTSPNPSFQSNLWRNNLYLPLIDLGHEVIEFEYDKIRETYHFLNPKRRKQREFIEQNRPRLSQELLKQIKAVHSIKPIDLFFSYFYDACVLPETIDEIKSMGIKTVNWYCNGSYQLHLVKEISPHYDWCLVPEKFRVKDYIRMGANPIYCQEAANPNIYKPYNIPQEFDVTFIGQAYGDRPAYIKYLLDQDINIRIWGQGWNNHTHNALLAKQQQKSIKTILRTLRISLKKKFQKDKSIFAQKYLNSQVELPSNIIGEVLSDLEMIQMYSRSKINIGFSTCGDTHRKGKRILQVRLRDFEVPMSSGFYMVEYMEELEEFYEIGKEIVCYHNAEDLADKIKYYLSHDSERKAIQKAGYERCIKDHTWHKRFEMAFKEMGLIQSCSSLS